MDLRQVRKLNTEELMEFIRKMDMKQTKKEKPKTAQLDSKNRYQVLDEELITDNRDLSNESEGSTGTIPKVARWDSESVLNSSKKKKKK